MTSTVPQTIFKISLQENTYETKITQGKMIDFELNKVNFSNGFYRSIGDTQTLDIIDCTAALYAFFPDIKTDLKLSDIRDLSPVETKEIFKEMIPFFKWYNEWKEFMQTPEKEEELKEEQSSDD